MLLEITFISCLAFTCFLKKICYNPGQCLFKASTLENNITSELQDPGGIFENVDTAPVPCQMNLKVLNKGISCGISRIAESASCSVCAAKALVEEPENAFVF